MSRVVVLGAGVSGHTAAAFARKWLGRQDEVVVVSPQPNYNWIPSNIWVGVGLMTPAKVSRSRSRRSTSARASCSSRRAPSRSTRRGGRAIRRPTSSIESTRPGHDGRARGDHATTS